MGSIFERREQKNRWARNHRDKVRAANKRWRQTFTTRYNIAAAARMRRYRARKAKLRTAKLLDAGRAAGTYNVLA